MVWRDERFRTICADLDRVRESTRIQVQALLDALDNHRQETRVNFRSVDEQLAEIKDLIINGRGRRDQYGDCERMCRPAGDH